MLFQIEFVLNVALLSTKSGRHIGWCNITVTATTYTSMYKCIHKCTLLCPNIYNICRRFSYRHKRHEQAHMVTVSFKNSWEPENSYIISTNYIGFLKTQKKILSWE